MSNQNKQPGPTVLSGSDDGELRIAVGSDRRDKIVFVVFGVPTAWLGMKPDQARAIAEAILKHADEIDPRH